MNSLDDEEREELDWLLEQGLALLDGWSLGPADPTDPSLIEASIRSAVAKGLVSAEQLDDAAFALGALWGDALCAANDHEWVSLEGGHAIAPNSGGGAPRRVFEEVRQWLRA